MLETLIPNRAHLYQGNCATLLAQMPENSIDACVTDPPYGLNSAGWTKPSRQLLATTAALRGYTCCAAWRAWD